MSANATLYVSNDTLVRVQGLRNASLSASGYVNDATMTATVVDSTGDEVSGQSWPLTLSYVSDSDGNYEGTIQDTAEITAGSSYTIKVTANKSGLKGYWELPATARARTR